jgi:hypothetical protein
VRFSSGTFFRLLKPLRGFFIAAEKTSHTICYVPLFVPHYHNHPAPWTAQGIIISVYIYFQILLALYCVIKKHFAFYQLDLFNNLEYSINSKWAGERRGKTPKRFSLSGCTE